MYFISFLKANFSFNIKIMTKKITKKNQKINNLNSKRNSIVQYYPLLKTPITNKRSFRPQMSLNLCPLILSIFVLK